MALRELSAKGAESQGHSRLPLPSENQRRLSVSETVEHQIHQYPTPDPSIGPSSPFDFFSNQIDLSNIRHTCGEKECIQLPSFARAAELARHLNEFHGPLLFCPFVECHWKGSKRKGRYNNHMRNVHGVGSEAELHVSRGFSEYAALTVPVHSKRIDVSSSRDGSTHLDYPTTALNALTPVTASTPMAVPTDTSTLDDETLDTSTLLLSSQKSLNCIEISNLLVDEVPISKLMRPSSGIVYSEAISLSLSNDSTSSGSASPPKKTDSGGDREYSYEDSSEVSSSDGLPVENSQEQSGELILNSKIAFARRQIVRRIMDQFWIVFKQATQGGTGPSEPSASSCNQSSSKLIPSSVELDSNRQISKRRRRTDQAQDSDDDGMGERPQADMALSPGKDMRKPAQFACPYRKHDPQTYNINDWKSCALTPRESIARVKGHLYKHHLVHQCSRCKALFKNEEQLQVHFVCIEGCQLSSEKPADGITAIIEKQLRSKKRSRQSQEDRWRGVYKILFPGDEVSNPSPYFEPVLEGVARSDAGEQPRSEDYVRRELPRVFRETLERAVNLETLPIEKHIQSQLHSMIQQCYETVLANYHASLAPSSTENNSQAPARHPEGFSSLHYESSMQAPLSPNNGNLWSTSTNTSLDWYDQPIASQPDMTFKFVPDTGYDLHPFGKSVDNHRQESTQPHSAEPFAMRPPIPAPPQYLPTVSLPQLENGYSQNFQFPQYENLNFGGNTHVAGAVPSLDWNPLPSLNPVAADPSQWTGLPDFEDERGYNFELYPQYNPDSNTPSSDE